MFWNLAYELIDMGYLQIWKYKLGQWSCFGDITLSVLNSCIDYINFIDFYTKEVQSGVCRGGGVEPTILKETLATGLVDGNNLLGL